MLMQINVKKLKLENEILTKKISDYENNVLNYNNELNRILDNWRSSESFSFFENRNHIRDALKRNMESLLELNKLYQYLVEKYEFIGDKIDISINGKDILISNINVLLLRLTILLKKYDELDYDIMDVSVKEKIITERNSVQETIKTFRVIKEKINDIYRYIMENEIKVNNKLLKIDVEIISEESVNL